MVKSTQEGRAWEEKNAKKKKISARGLTLGHRWRTLWFGQKWKSMSTGSENTNRKCLHNKYYYKVNSEVNAWTCSTSISQCVANCLHLKVFSSQTHQFTAVFHSKCVSLIDIGSLCLMKALTLRQTLTVVSHELYKIVCENVPWWLFDYTLETVELFCFFPHTF